jgi:hypothetical protein
MIWHAGRQVATVRDIGTFRMCRPVGSKVAVPVEKYARHGRDINERGIAGAYIIESYPHVAVTSAGTFSWAQIFYAERGVIAE